MNKRKLINDPVYGFISIPTELIFEIISHPYFQRLRRIRQLGLAEFVYTSATHSRFQHALGAMHLMGEALDVLRNKGIEISEMEKEQAQIAILLHDIGHGPFSHVLEDSILNNIKHENISLLLMYNLNDAFNGNLEIAIKMFKGSYHRPFFNQLISSQLDIDRLDYLNRDSFFTGVVEGTIGVKRIIKMMNIVNEELVIEEKGILSIENFLNARRIMYWQVYLHKTSLSAEIILKEILGIIKSKVKNEQVVSLSENLKSIFKLNPTLENIYKIETLNTFTSLDDYDIWYSIKANTNSGDKNLDFLSNSFLNRNLFKIKFFDDIISSDEINKTSLLIKNSGVKNENLHHYIKKGTISNSAYIPEDSSIKIFMKSGEIKNITDASDLPTILALGNIVKKNYLSWVNPLYLHF